MACPAIAQPLLTSHAACSLLHVLLLTVNIVFVLGGWCVYTCSVCWPLAAGYWLSSACCSTMTLVSLTALWIHRRYTLTLLLLTFHLINTSLRKSDYSYIDGSWRACDKHILLFNKLCIFYEVTLNENTVAALEFPVHNPHLASLDLFPVVHLFNFNETHLSDVRLGCFGTPSLHITWPSLLIMFDI